MPQALSNSRHHTHVLGGNTYYMPDGVTIYHGTYVPTVEAYTVSPHISTNQLRQLQQLQLILVLVAPVAAEAVVHQVAVAAVTKD